jgi:DNA-binding CsgD family transcriptional regulator
VSVTDSETPAPAPDRRSRGPGGRRLFERGPFLDELEALFTGSLPVPSRCIAIEGPWGSGRTALINAAADIAERAGCLVLRAKGGDVEHQTPLAVLGRLVEAAGGLRAVDAAARAQAHTLGGLLTDRSAAGADSGLLASHFHRLVLSLRQTAPVLLAIDDADRSDPDTLDALQYLVRRLEHQQIWLVVSARPLHPGTGLRPIDGLLTEPDTRQFVLDPLQPESVERILAGFFEERPDPEFVAACTEATGGSPFLLKALLPALQRAGVTPTADAAGSIEQVRAPKITQFLLARMAGLPDGGTELLSACAVLGEDADPSVTRQLAGVEPGTAEWITDAAEQLELLQAGRPLRFSTPLIRWSVYHAIPKARRSWLHAAAADLLEAQGADPATVGGHLLAAGPTGAPGDADRLHRIGRLALDRGDDALALRCLERALSDTAPADRSGRLYLDLATAEAGLADGGSLALDHLQRAVELGGSDDVSVVRVGVGLLGRLAGDPTLRHRVLALLHGLRALDGLDRDVRMELELALIPSMDAPDQRIGCLDRLSGLLAEPGDDGTAVSRLARSAVTLHEVLSSPGLDADRLASELMEIVDVDQLVSADPVAGWVQTTALLGLLGADRFETVDELLATAAARERPDHPPEVGGRVSALSALSLSWQGSLVAADEACTRQYERQYERQGSAPGGGTVAPVTGHIDVLVQQGRIDDAQRLADSREAGRIEPTVLWALSQIELGRLLVAQGAAGGAAALFESAGDTAARAELFSPAIVPWRADAALTLADQGRFEEAGWLADENLALARRFGAPRTTGLALRAAAAATPDLSLRSTLLTEAAEVLESSGARLERAHALVALGTTLIELDRKEEARGVLRQGASLASLCGAHQLLEVAGDRLRAAGARPRRLGLVGPESLTPAELRVVLMAADGLTNQRIADELFVTLKTVEGHLAKAYRKLGVDGRPELAEALAGRDDGGDGGEYGQDGELPRASSL